MAGGKDDVLRVRGTVVETLPNAMFKINLESGLEVIARAGRQDAPAVVRSGSCPATVSTLSCPPTIRPAVASCGVTSRSGLPPPQAW